MLFDTMSAFIVYDKHHQLLTELGFVKLVVSSIKYICLNEKFCQTSEVLHQQVNEGDLCVAADIE